LLKKISIHENILRLKIGMKRSLGILRSRGISDHWKEKAIPRYAQFIFAESLKFFAYIILLLMSFVFAFVGIEMLFRTDINVVLGRLYSWELQLLTVVIGLLFLLIRPSRK